MEAKILDRVFCYESDRELKPQKNKCHMYICALLPIRAKFKKGWGCREMPNFDHTKER